MSTITARNRIVADIMIPPEGMKHLNGEKSEEMIGTVGIRELADPCVRDDGEHELDKFQYLRSRVCTACESSRWKLVPLGTRNNTGTMLVMTNKTERLYSPESNKVG